MTQTRLAVLVSGNGSNLQALIDTAEAGDLHCDICVVLSNRAEAFALQRAERAGIPAQVVSHRDYATREEFDRAILEVLAPYAPDLLALAGFMRILGPEFVHHYAGRILNVHPSLLPAFPGLDTHARVLQAGVAEHGASIHFVTEELDAGPVVVQGKIAVNEGDTDDGLAERVHTIEHRIYPAAVAWYAQGRLRYRDHAVWFDGKRLREPIII